MNHMPLRTGTKGLRLRTAGIVFYTNSVRGTHMPTTNSIRSLQSVVHDTTVTAGKHVPAKNLIKGYKLVVPATIAP